MINKKLTTSYLRKLCRMESAQVRERQRQEILDTRPTDTKLFYRLINKQRENVRHCVNELSANGEVYKTDGDILTGWRDRFKSFATPSNDAKFDMKYSRMVSEEIPIIMDMCKDTPATTITTEQVGKAIISLNRGKAPDFFGVMAEHFVYGGEALVEARTNIINSLLGFGKVTEALKIARTQYDPDISLTENAKICYLGLILALF